jgi:ABC-type multidrug transport system permease subunit
LGKRRLDILLSLFPSRLFPETLLPLIRLLSLVAAILIGFLFVYFVLSVMATYLGFNPFGIVSGIPTAPIPNQ